MGEVLASRPEPKKILASLNLQEMPMHFSDLQGNCTHSLNLQHITAMFFLQRIFSNLTTLGGIPSHGTSLQAVLTSKFAAALLVLLAADRVRADDWPQWLGPHRNGVSNESVEPWSQPPSVIWQKEIPGGFSVPVVADGKLFVHTDDPGKDGEQVFAYNAVTGELIWQDRYDRAAYQSALGSGPRATPSVVDGKLYTMGITGVLTCYDSKSGQRLWQKNPFDELQASRPGFGVCSSPLVVDGKIIFSVGGEGSGVVAYDASSGELAWKMLDEPAAAASPILVSHARGEEKRSEVVVQTTLRLLGVDIKDGTILWEHPLVFQPSGVSPTPLMQDDILVCSTQDNGTLALALPKSDDDSPSVAWWNQNVSSYFSTGSVGADGRVFTVTNVFDTFPRADLRCIDARSGKEYWVKKGLGYFHVGLIRLADDRLLILDDAGHLILADVSGDGYRELCRAKACDGTFANPVLARGRVYVRDAKKIVCLSLLTDNQSSTASVASPSP